MFILKALKKSADFLGLGRQMDGKKENIHKMNKINPL
jgi:hypothetical protein